MILRRADMHTHTYYSDGALAPAELVRKASAYGLSALVVTDHDTIEGLPEAMEAGEALGVKVAPGVELSVTVGRREIHLLGYFFDPDHQGLRDYLTAYRDRRWERGMKMVERLQGLGIQLDLSAVIEQAGEGVLGRPHVARALHAGGYVDTYDEAFSRYLADGGPAFVPKAAFPAEQALALLHEAGGIGVIAHPGHWTSTEVLMTLIRQGLDGIETVHPAHDVMLRDYYREIVSEFLLIETGGSDYHGFREQDEENFGHLSIPYARFEKARRRARMGMATS